MKEVLFRAQEIETKNWIYGFYVNKFDIGINTHLIITKKGFEYNIIPETVGQFIGLTDKNGKKIFEGDILNYGFRTNDFVEFAIHKCSKPAHGGPDEYEYLGYETDSAYRGNYRNSVIIGNIFDDPELIKNY